MLIFKVDFIFHLLSPGERNRAELLVAADQVCDSIRRLVDTVRVEA